MLGTIWNNILSFVSSIGIERLTSREHFMPLALGVALQFVIILLIIFFFRLWRRKNWKFSILFDLLLEKVYEFFEEILEETGKRWIKVYVVSLFFVILLSNLSSWLLDVVRIVFVDNEALTHYIQIPTTSFEFNIAIALVSVVLFLVAQFRFLWVWKFFHEYVPIFGNWILDISRDEVKWWLYWPAKVVIKLFDIAISLFVWLLDIVWIFAKVISLSARLYGNMIAGGVLLTFLVIGINSLTQNLMSVDFPLLAPLVLYAQGLLVALIQAFVFPLLVGIFMKLAQTTDE